MVDRLGPRARKVLVLAEEEARMCNHNTIRTEHILLGLVQAGGIAGALLTELEIDLDSVHEQVEKIVGRGQVFSAGRLPLSEQAIGLLKRSSTEATRLGQDDIDTEHLLLGMLGDDEDAGLLVLKSLGADPARLRERVLEKLDQVPQPIRVAAGPVRSADLLLRRFGRSLTDAARAGELDPVVDREAELERLVQILLRRRKNNPVLLGEPGVGKTALVEALACRMVSGQVPEELRDKRLYELDLGSMIAGASRRGVFEERFRTVLHEASDDGGVLLFVDELHTLVGAGDETGGLDAAALVKPMLARGELRIIGATTPEEYRTHIARDATLERRFQPLSVEPPTVAGTIKILKELRPRYESHHGVTFTDESLVAAARLTDRHVTGRSLPDKAIDAIDEAGALARIRALAGSTAPPTPQQVTEELVVEVVAAATGIPLERLTAEELTRLRGLEAELRKRVIGQDSALAAVGGAIRRARAGVADPDRPVGSFLFAGPSGVGKSELAKALAAFLFGQDEALVQIDMSEYGESHAVSKLFGAPPGYAGYDEGGRLTRHVRENPFSVVLFDEIEKAHPSVADVLLQILEEGRLTSGDGRTVTFTSAVVIMTTNIGTREAYGVSGFGPDDDLEDGLPAQRTHEAVHAELRRHLRPELLNRVDEVVVFSRLGRAQLMAIMDLAIAGVAQRLLDGTGAMLEISAEAKHLLFAMCHDPALGARPLRRIVQRELDDVLSTALLNGRLRSRHRVTVGVEGGSTLAFSIT
ncbi:ATP-dependent Clp protease ATP-binding subunit [Nonomuraea muscovyensis]|uniref:ATP-dependent Clp protease ATP-binding subunit n=1 Tax=Nonomuraea muscovyensis TaxID=1124761 RepID=UPI0033DE4DD5|nr:ATPase domain protein [Nonomuraea muscovyensis]